MKPEMKVLALMTVMVLAALPAYAITEGTEAAVPGKTLVDFQKEFAGTKPVVGWNKYQDFMTWGRVPQPSLGVQQMRATPLEKSIADYMLGSKPAAGFLRYQEAKRDAARMGVDPKAAGTVFQPYARAGSGKAVTAQIW